MVKRTHALTGEFNVTRLSLSTFYGCADDPNAQRFGQEKGVPTLSGVVLFKVLDVDEA